MTLSAAQLLLLYLVIPVWLIAGYDDWWCHRATHIESTSGIKESWLHLLMITEVGIPLLGALFLDVKALVLLALMVGFTLHQFTVIWDVSYTTGRRPIKPIEQHVHSVLEMAPWMVILLLATEQWGQFIALFGQGNETARFDLTWHQAPLPPAYVVGFFALAFLQLALFLEELGRGRRACRRKLENFTQI